MGAVIGQDDLGEGKEAGAVVIGNGFRCLLNQRAFSQIAKTENRSGRSKGHESGARTVNAVTEIPEQSSMRHQSEHGHDDLWISNAVVFTTFSISCNYLLTGHFNRLA